VVDGDLVGIAVHIGARVAAAAQPREVLVSRTVADLVAGSGIVFRDRGSACSRASPGAGSCTRSTNDRDGTRRPVAVDPGHQSGAPAPAGPRDRIGCTSS
jgi:class 3 adenylate cyclase